MYRTRSTYLTEVTSLLVQTLTPYPVHVEVNKA
jgi:hypothetical protein